MVCSRDTSAFGRCWNIREFWLHPARTFQRILRNRSSIGQEWKERGNRNGCSSGIDKKGPKSPKCAAWVTKCYPGCSLVPPRACTERLHRRTRHQSWKIATSNEHLRNKPNTKHARAGDNIGSQYSTLLSYHQRCMRRSVDWHWISEEQVCCMRLILRVKLLPWRLNLQCNSCQAKMNVVIMPAASDYSNMTIGNNIQH